MLSFFSLLSINSNIGSFWSIRFIYTLERSSQSRMALCFFLLALSTLNLLQSASKLIAEPGNLFLAISSVSITLSLGIVFLFIKESSLLRWPISKSALWIIIFLPSINFKKSSAMSLNFFLSAKNSSVYPWTFSALSETFLSGF